MHIVLQFYYFRVSKSQDRKDALEAYGHDKLVFETVHNIDEYATETVSTMREALRVRNHQQFYAKKPSNVVLLLSSETHAMLYDNDFFF